MTTAASVPRPVVGFIGIGDQGAPMAQAISEAGYTLHVWARRPESLAALGAAPFVAEPTVEALGRACEIVSLCLRDDPDLWDVLDNQGLLAAMKPRSIIVNHGTGDPRESEIVSAHVARAGCVFLDAPVSGGRPGAEARCLSTFVGGESGAFDRCQPLFRSFSASVEHMGGPGRGQLTKLLNNALTTTNTQNANDVLAIAEGLGFDLGVFGRVMAHGSGNSAALQNALRIVPSEVVEHLQRLMRKDMEHFAVAVRSYGIDPTDVYHRGVAGVDGLSGTAALVRSDRRASDSGKRSGLTAEY
jgi:3-hydroxyisobutyrate dehydrogenase-like beta-hydroxyacid dehydrogenase